LSSSNVLPNVDGLSSTRSWNHDDFKFFLAKNVLPRIRYLEELQRDNDKIAPAQAKRGKKGDFAEWFSKLSMNEELNPGDVIGIHGSCVSKKTAGALFVSVVPDRALLVGNPWGVCPDLRVASQVTFIGQALVRLDAHNGCPVRVGDYLIPSGKDDGFAINKAPRSMTLPDYGNVVGRCVCAKLDSGSNVRAIISISTAQNGFAGAIDQYIKDIEEQLGKERMKILNFSC
jgi:hypothetical protein